MKLLDLAIPSSILLHLLVAPYTKVEESFNIQATHDILIYGTPTTDADIRLASSYDHFTFPGAVPRTFVGATVLAGLARPIITVVGFEHAQFVVRAVIGALNAAALVIFSKSLGRAFGSGVERWYVLLQAVQFHVMFYASRTLPNMFAFGLTTLAFACLLPQEDPSRTAPRQRLALSFLVFAGVIFRAEIALLLATVGLSLLFSRQTTLIRLIRPCIISGFAALLTSVPVDSYFWQRLIWPELSGFFFNVVNGSASEWGVSPWHYYFTSAIPRLLLNPVSLVVLIPMALFMPGTSRAARSLLTPSLLFVSIYSLQPHKETRFIFYVVPPLTAVAALGANAIATRRTKSLLYTSTFAIIALSIAATGLASAAMLFLSSLNYPGGEALHHLSILIARTSSTASANKPIQVHTDVLACMTGVTLFGQNPSGQPRGSPNPSGPTIIFDKTEDEKSLMSPVFWDRFDYILTEQTPSSIPGISGKWEVAAVVNGYAGIEILKPGIEPTTSRSVGKAAIVARARDKVRSLTGGWWIGPRTVPKIRVLRRSRKGGFRAAL